MGEKVLRVATYSRVSTSHHKQNPEVQVQALQKYCQARGWAIAHELVDHGYSGGTAERPALKELQRLVREREVDVVVVVKLDRLFRSLKHLVVTLEEWEAVGVKFISVKDAVDWTTAAGRFFIQVLGSLAELQKSILVERTMMGLDHARSKGKILGRPKSDYSAIQKLRAQGRTYTQIQNELGVGRATIFRALEGVPKTPKNQPEKSE